MKKKGIWISLAIVIAVVCLIAIYLSSLPKGQIKIDTPGAEIQLRGRFGTKTILSKGPVSVGAGLYRTQHLQIKTKRDGDAWQIESLGPWGTLEQIEVKENQTTALKLGPPFLVKPEVESRPTAVSIGLTITGQAGEQYRNAITKNNQRIPPAKIKILDEAGATLVSGNFEYG
jgi:hypothetical protein